MIRFVYGMFCLFLYLCPGKTAHEVTCTMGQLWSQESTQLIIV